jgi:Dockerin type I domain
VGGYVPSRRRCCWLARHSGRSDAAMHQSPGHSHPNRRVSAAAESISLYGDPGRGLYQRHLDHSHYFSQCFLGKRYFVVHQYESCRYGYHGRYDRLRWRVDIAIDPTGSMTPGTAVTVEPRTIGAGYQIVFLFDSPPTSATVTTTSGTGVVAFAGNEATVTLTGVTDATRVQVGLSAVNGTALSATAVVGFLVGDVNGSRLVNSTDVLTVKAVSGATAVAGNFKFDLNASGLINSTDVLTVKASSGHTLP